jgi:hypothetical protein
MVETTDGIYSYGQVLDAKIAIAASGDTCAETEPLSLREQKVTRIYRGYGDSATDVAIQRNGTRVTGSICSREIHFRHSSGIVETISMVQIRDIVLKMR